MNYDLLWSKVLDKISQEVNSVVYKTWFQNTRLYKIEKTTATIVVEIFTQKKRLSENADYLSLIINALHDNTNQIYDINFLLEDEIVDKQELLSTNKVDNNSNIESKVTYNHSSNLIKNYTFDTFVVGNSNKLAQAAAFMVAESPGEVYNPLFIYGSSGLGKTHLMHAIGNYIEENSNKKVLYISSQQFTDDFTRINLKDDKKKNNFDYAEYFKNKYRSIDVLIIDDIQFLASKTKTQEEFFHTFNILHDEKKQIILSSDRSPNDLKDMEERLKTRFCWGLTVDIYPPEFELRKSILRKKIQGSNLLQEIPEDVIEYIASNMTSDVRNLEGAINRLIAYSFMMGCKEINLSMAVDALKDIINKGTSEKANIQKVQKAVADYWKISVDDLKSKKRSASIAFPRQVAMYLSRTLLNESFERIGLEFGGKDHSTVMHSCDKIKEELERNNELINSIEVIKKNLI